VSDPVYLVHLVSDPPEAGHMVAALVYVGSSPRPFEGFGRHFRRLTSWNQAAWDDRPRHRATSSTLV